jgi:ubiquinone biosynthesis protein
MVFEDGFYHADPHPGNLFVEADGRLGLIDFGMVGTVDAATQEQLAAVLLAVTGGDAGRLADALLEMGVARRRVDREQLARDLGGLTGRYYGRPLAEIPLGPLLEEAFGVVRRHRLQLPPRLALLLKTAVMCEGLGAQLAPDFRLTALLEPYARRLLFQQYAPDRLARRLGEAGVEAARLGVELPAQLRRLVADAERGALEVGVRPEGFEPLVRRLERLANRLVLGVLAAAFVNGLAVLMAAYHPGGNDAWIAAFFAFGFAVTALLGAYLAWLILRSGQG